MKSTATILVIDDTPENLAVLFDVLGAADFEVLIVESGEIALERMGVLLPDLILLDVRLPGMNGIDVCRRLKATPTFAEVPVIILTALDATADTVAGFAAGAADYLCKPVDPQEVLVRVRTQLKIRQLQQALEERNRALTVEVHRRRAAERQIEQALNLGIMVVSGDGKVEFATKRAWDLLLQFHPEATYGLPETVAAWLEARTGAELRVRRPESVLVIRIQADTTPGDSRLLRIEEKSMLHDPVPLERLGLTPRESEILYWIAQGKSSPEIASILDSALNTVKKHAQHIYHKLGVDNRTTAALRAVEILQSDEGKSGLP